MEERKLITDKKETEKMVNSFFSLPLKSRVITGLTCLSEKQGFGGEFESFLFKHDLDEYDMTFLQQPMTNRHILISFDYPAAEEDCEAYVTFEEFYEYLKKPIKHVLNTAEGNELFDSLEINQLLEKVKTALEIGS